VLSPREQTVLRGVVAGRGNKVIAYEMGISPRTVETHRANMMMKTGARSLSELVRRAFQAGIDG
jgi:two-component system response regulator FixJ